MLAHGVQSLRWSNFAVCLHLPVCNDRRSDEYADGVGPSTCSAGDGIDASTGIDAAHAENPFFALMMWLGVVLLRTIVTEFL